MDWKTVGAAVAQNAPTLGNMVALATDATSAGVLLLVSALAFAGEATPDALHAEVQKPESAALLKAFETARLMEMVQLQMPRTRTVRDDLNAENGKTAFWSAAVISTIITLGFFVAFYILAHQSNTVLANGAKPPELPADLHMLVGALIAGFTQVISYYLGSSSSSQAKTQLLANSTPRS